MKKSTTFKLLFISVVLLITSMYIGINTKDLFFVIPVILSYALMHACLFQLFYEEE